MIVKLSVVRTSDDASCPFGLNIPFGCKYAGDAVDKMAAFAILGPDITQEEKDKIQKANNRFLSWSLADSELKHKCKYADQLIENKEAVVCNYTDSAPGVSHTSLFGSPYYSRIMSGNSMQGLYSYPIGLHADYNASRNDYYGLFSLQGAQKIIINKVAKHESNYDGSCILFYCEQDSSVLLLKRADMVNQPRTWGLPGGRKEHGEHPVQCVLRETQEEIGFIPGIHDIESYGILEIGTEPNCVVFVAQISKETKDKYNSSIILNNEHTEHRWFKTSEIPDDLHSVPKLVFQETDVIS